MKSTTTISQPSIHTSLQVACTTPTNTNKRQHRGVSVKTNFPPRPHKGSKVLCILPRCRAPPRVPLASPLQSLRGLAAQHRVRIEPTPPAPETRALTDRFSATQGSTEVLLHDLRGAQGRATARDFDDGAAASKATRSSTPCGSPAADTSAAPTSPAPPAAASRAASRAALPPHGGSGPNTLQLWQRDACKHSISPL